MNIQGAPDLVVEILFPSTIDTDRIFKKHVYEKSGVKEYWIVDPENEIIEVFKLIGKKFKLFQKANKSQIIESSILKGFEIKLSSIFADFISR